MVAYERVGKLTRINIDKQVLSMKRCWEILVFTKEAKPH